MASSSQDESRPRRETAPEPRLAAAEPRHTAANSLVTAAALSLVAGTLDGFAYVGHGHVFAGAMTGNVVLLGVFTAQGSALAFNYLFQILSYVVGVFAANLVQRPVFRPLLIKSPELTGVCLEIFGLCFVAALPAGFEDRLLVAMITLGAAMQNTIFRNIGSNSYNSVIMTGNLQNFAHNLAAGLFPLKDKQLSQAKNLGAVCLSFVVGAVLGAVLTPRLGNPTLLCPAAILFVVATRLMRSTDG